MKTKTFYSKTDLLSLSYLFISFLPLIVGTFLFDNYWDDFNKRISRSLIYFLPATYFIYEMFTTKYIIEDNLIRYQFGFLKGNISIEDIKLVQLGKTMWVGRKFGLASKGMIISYNRFDEIYFTPKEQDLFLEELQKINPNIKIEK
jgi:hypothetical protein